MPLATAMSGAALDVTMSIDPAEFRRVLSRFATGVTVVAASEPDGRACGLTATAIASVSLEPPLVLACVDRAADTHDCIDRAGVFAISVLGSGSRDLAQRFAEAASSVKFEGVDCGARETGSPVLDAAIAWLDCRLWASYDGGDHTIFVGEVVAAGAGPGAPLLHYEGGFGQLES